MTPETLVKYFFSRFDNTDRDDWLRQRTKGIGGTETSAILGINPWMTPYDVWEDKVRGRRQAEPSVSMRRGQFLEPCVAELYCESTGYKLFSPENRLFVHPEHDFIFGTPDRIIVTPDERIGILEIKTAVSFGVEKWSAGVPEFYKVQGMKYLGIASHNLKKFGLDGKIKEPLFLQFAALLDDTYYESPEFAYDGEFIDHIFEADVRFWKDHVLTGVPPELQSLNEIRRYFDKVREGEIVQIGLEDLRCLAELDAVKKTMKELQQDPVVKAQIDSLKDAQNRLEVKIGMLFGDKEIMEYDGTVVATHKKLANDSRRLDLKRSAIRSLIPCQN